MTATNAIVDALWARMNVETFNQATPVTWIDLADVIFEHLEILHNPQRRHSSLGQ